MIEMVYKGKDGAKNEEKKLPKNVRQIGEAGKGKRIYLEDYAVTYLHQVEAAVLLGNIWEKEGVRYIFVRGAIQASDPAFEQDIWEEIYRDARTYFPDSEILGWSMQSAESVDPLESGINQIYKTHFDREDTVLLIHEPAEKEDTVFVEENGSLKKSGGYFVYYDKNLSMQEYMVSRNTGKSVEQEQTAPDKAIKNFRKRSEEKKDKQEKEKAVEKQPKNTRFLYAASTFLVLAVMVIAVTMISNYDKMKTMEMALSTIVGSTEQAAPANAPVRETAAPGEQEQAVKTAETAEETAEMAEETAAAAERETKADVQSASVQNAVSAGEKGQQTREAGKDGQAQGTAGRSGLSGSGLAALGESGAPDGEKGQAAGGEEAEASAQVRPTQAFYTVKDGDTLVDICRMYYGTDDKLDALCSFNGITDPNSIVPGQKIKLP